MNTLKRWTVEQANEWYARQPWLVGCNFIPSSAINQLEMWQAETFDRTTIDRELGWAANLGFNTVRTYLHDLAWETDANGFKQRVNEFLDIASHHGIRPILVIFDDCWNSNPAIGAQPAPKPGVHNSGWVQSPSNDVSHQGPSAWGRLERYVSGMLSTFADDQRILLWDLYNEPGNGNNGVRSLPLLQAVFEWARCANPSQPLTAGLWFDNAELNEFQLSASDVITFHNYNPVDNLEREIRKLKAYGRPLICTEWMARACGSLVSSNLSVFAREKVGCLNWGLVAGKTNTIYPWEVMPTFIDSVSWSKEAQANSTAWFHDLLYADGTPYDNMEVELFRKYTATARGVDAFPTQP
jgi:hypothetical protein